MARIKLNKDLDFLKNIALTASKGVAKYPVISTCPVCHHDLIVTKLKCSHCDAELSGEFTLSKFNYLDTEKLYFIETFVKNRGSIKMVEKEMGLSYPTIKKMLDDVIEGLGYPVKGDSQPKEEPNKSSKKEILMKVANGELSSEEAAELLAKIKRG